MCIRNRDSFTVGVIGQDTIEFGRRLVGGIHNRSVKKMIWGPHSGHYESYIFWDITLCSPLKVNRRLPPDFTQISFLVYFSTLKMEATCSSETSVDF
jgi:hypothetical protein